jgi:hypothetical protein
LEVLIGWNQHRPAIGHGDRHFVIEVIRQLKDDFVSGINDGEDRVCECHVSPGRHHDSRPLIDPERILEKAFFAAVGQIRRPKTG